MGDEQQSKLEWARERLTEICEAGDLPLPDRFEDHSEDDEIYACWDQRKVVVVIELEGRRHE